MKTIFKNIIVALLIVATLELSGCSKQAERRQRQKFQVVSLDGVTGSISDGWRISLTVANNTASNLHITAGSAFIHQGGRKIARVVLDGEVLLPRRRCSQVVVPLRLTLSNPIAALSLLNRVRKGDFSNITVDYSISVAAFTSHRTFEQDGVSLEELAKQFNLGLKK
jgi:hypothetical protein